MKGEKNSVDESACSTRSQGWRTTASKLDAHISCSLRHVVFESPKNRKVTREGHEVRVSVFKEHQEGRQKETRKIEECA